jgi:hypothetical protein
MLPAQASPPRPSTVVHAASPRKEAGKNSQKQHLSFSAVLEGSRSVSGVAPRAGSDFSHRAGPHAPSAQLRGRVAPAEAGAATAEGAGISVRNARAGDERAGDGRAGDGGGGGGVERDGERERPDASSDAESPMLDPFARALAQAFPIGSAFSLHPPGAEPAVAPGVSGAPQAVPARGRLVGRFL